MPTILLKLDSKKVISWELFEIFEKATLRSDTFIITEAYVEPNRKSMELFGENS